MLGHNVPEVFTKIEGCSAGPYNVNGHDKQYYKLSTGNLRVAVLLQATRNLKGGGCYEEQVVWRLSVFGLIHPKRYCNSGTFP